MIYVHTCNKTGFCYGKVMRVCIYVKIIYTEYMGIVSIYVYFTVRIHICDIIRVIIMTHVYDI